MFPSLGYESTIHADISGEHSTVCSSGGNDPPQLSIVGGDETQAEAFSARGRESGISRRPHGRCRTWNFSSGRFRHSPSGVTARLFGFHSKMSFVSSDDHTCFQGLTRYFWNKKKHNDRYIQRVRHNVFRGKKNRCANLTPYSRYVYQYILIM